MKKTICTTLVAAVAGLSPLAAQPEFDEAAWSKDFRAKAVAFLTSLGPDEQQAVRLEFADKARWEMKFPGGKRPGLRVGELKDAQKEALQAVGRMVLSEVGLEAAEAITAQGPGGGFDRLWVTVFGDPRKGDFAIRVAEHHFTVVNVEMKEGLPTQVGPILLGSNPPDLFAEEENALLEAWKTLSDDEKTAIKGKGKGASGRALGEKEGIPFSELSEEAREAIQSAGRIRGQHFSEAIRARVMRLAKARGGDEKIRVAYYFDKEEPAKRCKDGGRWDFKFGIPGSVLWDWQGSSGHIHMSLWVK